jgi:hypothetical protein
MSDPRTTPQRHPSKIPSKKKRLRNVAIGVPFRQTSQEKCDDSSPTMTWGNRSLQVYHGWSFAPQSLQTVELSFHLAKDMNNNITVIEQ